MDYTAKKTVESETTRSGSGQGPESEAGFEVESNLEGTRIDSGVSLETPSEPMETVMPSAGRPAVAIPAAVRTRDPLLIEVERRLEDNLWEVYLSMPQQLRRSFKEEGERVARVVRDGLAAGRLAARSILFLIVRWLGMIPGVNRWFLIQEAKIKTDSLIRLGLEKPHRD